MGSRLEKNSEAVRKRIEGREQYDHFVKISLLTPVKTLSMMKRAMSTRGASLVAFPSISDARR